MPRRILPPVPRAATRGLAVLAAVFGAAAFAAPVQAATLSFSGSDPKGDHQGATGLDLTNVALTFDTATGGISATVDLAAPFSSAQGALVVFLGTSVGGVCPYANLEADPTTVPPAVQIALVNAPQLPDTPFFSMTGELLPGEPTISRAGTQITVGLTPSPTLVGQTFDCIYASTRYENADQTGGLLADEMSLFIKPGETGTAPGKTPSKPDPVALRPPVKLITAEADGDRDGTPDASDACPTAPGALSSGCPATAPGGELRLGAKRVVVDRLVPATNGDCPAKITITVTSIGKTIGTGTFPVDQFGVWCRVSGVVRLEKRRAKVRVIAKEPGLAGTAKSVRR